VLRVDGTLMQSSASLSQPSISPILRELRVGACCAPGAVAEGFVGRIAAIAIVPRDLAAEPANLVAGETYFGVLGGVAVAGA